MERFQVQVSTKQGGAALVVSLLILVVITLLAISGMETTQFEEKMAFNVRDSHTALQVAEAGARDGEQFIDTLVSSVDFADDGTGGLYAVADFTQDGFKKSGGPNFKSTGGTAPVDPFADGVWSAGKFRTASAANEVQGQRATYFIEEVGPMQAEDSGAEALNVAGYGAGDHGAGTVTAFRIISKGSGRTTATERIVEVYYGKRL